jgi:hypothetical protein
MRLDRPLLAIRAPFLGLRKVLAIIKGVELCTVDFMAKFPLPLQTEVRVVDLFMLIYTRSGDKSGFLEKAVQRLASEHIKAAQLNAKPAAEKVQSTPFDLAVLDRSSLTKLEDQPLMGNEARFSPSDGRAVLVVPECSNHQTPIL